MLTTAVLLAGLLTSEPQSIARPAPVRQPSASTSLARRFATLFPVEGSTSTLRPNPPTDFSPRTPVPDHRLPNQDRQEVLCGLTVVTKSADIDPRIIVSPKPGIVPAARRIEPDVCRPADTGRK